MIETLNRDRRSLFAGDKIMSHFAFRGSSPHLTQVCVNLTTFNFDKIIAFNEISTLPIELKITQDQLRSMKKESSNRFFSSIQCCEKIRFKFFFLVVKITSVIVENLKEKPSFVAACIIFNADTNVVHAVTNDSIEQHISIIIVVYVVILLIY